MGKKRDNVRWTAVSVSCVLLHPLHGKLSTSIPSRECTRVCTVGIGKTFQISFQVGPFFPSARPYRHPRAHSTSGEMRNVHQGWAYRTSGRRSPFYFAAGFSFLEFLSLTARYACRFSRAPHLYDIAVLEKLYIFLLPLLYITQRPETDMSLSARAYSEERSISKQYANVF